MVQGSANIERHIAQRLRQQREAHGMTHEELAKRLAVSPTEIRLFEEGAKKIPPQRLIQAAETFKTPLSWFLEGAPDGCCGHGMSAVSADLIRFLQMPEAYALVSAFVAIPCPKRRQAVIDSAQMANRSQP